MFKKIRKLMFHRPNMARFIFNLYKPFRGAGIKVVSISSDFRTIKVEMPLRKTNKNIMGSHFGGSLYAMADPFFMYMLMQALGSRYYVWDQEATIRFLKPAYSNVLATYQLRPSEIDQIVKQTALGQKCLHAFKTVITQSDGQVVAEIEKIVYCRLKKQYRPA